MAQVPALVFAEGECIDYTPAAAVNAGDVVLVGGIALIAPLAIAAGQKGILDHDRAYKVPKVTGVMKFGDLVYWDSSGNPDNGPAGSGAATLLAGSGFLLGTCILDAASGDDYVAIVQPGLGPSAAVTGAAAAGMGASTAAAGTTFADAGALPAGTARVYPTTAADDTKGVIIHANDKVTGRTLYIANGVANKILKVYGPSGAVINGAAANAAFSSVSGKGVTITCTSSTANTWTATS